MSWGEGVDGRPGGTGGHSARRRVRAWAGGQRMCCSQQVAKLSVIRVVLDERGLLHCCEVNCVRFHAYAQRALIGAVEFNERAEGRTQRMR